MRKLLSFVMLMMAMPILAQTNASSSAPDAWKDLGFLEGTWSATGHGPGTVSASGKYAFVRELDGHVMARHSTTDANCKGPATFDCAHGDLLYIFADAPGQPLKAIYLDNEGHVIHYEVSTPEAGTAIFLSVPGPGPRFRLTYQLKAGVMTGKFQMQMPGQEDWKSYLEWSGGKA